MNFRVEDFRSFPRKRKSCRRRWVPAFAGTSGRGDADLIRSILPVVTKTARRPHDRRMQLSSTLAWLVDAAGESPGADRLLAELGAHLIKDGLPLAGGALTLAIPHPLIARRTWLWRADSGEVIEALGFAPGRSPAARQASPSNRRRPALARRHCGGPRARGHRSDRGRMGLRSAGSGRARSRPARPNNCDRPRASPRRRLRRSPRAPH